MSESRFQSVVLLHDRDGSSDALELAGILAGSHPAVAFSCPQVPPADNAMAQLNLMAVRLLPYLQPKSLVVGLGLGGLLAIALQERLPSLDLSVAAINPPVEQDGVEAAWDTGPSAGERLVLYSSQHAGQEPSLWSRYADHAFDVPWLSGGVREAFYATSYVVSAFMRGLRRARA